jgi:biopolymer transport protein ExbD
VQIREDRPIDELNMVPFIDIMLVLLTIVLTTSSFIASGSIPVRLPQAAASQAEQNEAVTIVLDEEGAIFHQGEKVGLEELRGRLAGLDPGASFLLRADKRVQLQKFIDVVDLLKQSGFSKVAVQTETKE